MRALAAATALLCREAHARGVAAGEVIVSVKALLGGIVALREPARHADAARLQDELVTRCIRTYYAR